MCVLRVTVPFTALSAFPSSHPLSFVVIAFRFCHRSAALSSVPFICSPPPPLHDDAHPPLRRSRRPARRHCATRRAAQRRRWSETAAAARATSNIPWTPQRHSRAAASSKACRLTCRALCLCVACVVQSAPLLLCALSASPPADGRRPCTNHSSSRRGSRPHASAHQRCRVGSPLTCSLDLFAPVRVCVVGVRARWQLVEGERECARGPARRLARRCGATSG